ncbi:MAG: hypothetical protein Q4P15_12740 [Propionibacteriaceae bacterium]|nr:hypothetical protein [Propionibacteriaceae bacterium]
MPGQRIAKKSTERTLALTILVVGTLAAVASLFGGIWFVRAGAVVAVAMALIAVGLVWREMERERHHHQEEVRRQVALRVSQADAHHGDALAMIDRFNSRVDNLKSVIAKLRRQLGAANSELSSMRGNSVWLRGEISERQSRIDALTARLAVLENQQATNVIPLPRRSTATLDPRAEDLWAQGEHPTMVDLAKVQLDVFEETLLRA